MRELLKLGLLVVVLVVPADQVLAQAGGAGRPRELLTNESVIDLSRAGFKERTIITLIRTSETAFDISTLKLVELKRRGVNERIISEMIERTNAGEAMRRQTTLRNDDFFSKADEEFFKGSTIYREVPTEKQARQREEEAHIFGSQSGTESSSRTRGWGGNGDRQQSTEMTGSASVRILRPAGDTTGTTATPKLERPTKLDNRGVLDLVQAGFSEGTIVRKIELAQVDFDLSPSALGELRQNRVSDRIIRAMTSAMDESK
ncbi:MAG: hypothetical protein RIR52_2279 [Acidobacteriota bacterium]|jgi:hypothetical protein